MQQHSPQPHRRHYFVAAVKVFSATHTVAHTRHSSLVWLRIQTVNLNELYISFKWVYSVFEMHKGQFGYQEPGHSFIT